MRAEAKIWKAEIWDKQPDLQPAHGQSDSFLGGVIKYGTSRYLLGCMALLNYKLGTDNNRLP